MKLSATESVQLTELTPPRAGVTVYALKRFTLRKVPAGANPHVNFLLSRISNHSFRNIKIIWIIIIIIVDVYSWCVLLN